MFKKISSKIKDYFKDLFSDKIKRGMTIAFFAVPLLVTVIIEILNRRSFIKCLKFMFGSPLAFIANAGIIFFTFSFVLLLRKRYFGIMTIAVVWLACGITNFILKSYRETPFTASDFRNIDSALKLFDKYLSVTSILLLIAAFMVVIIIIGIIFIKSPKFAPKINYIRNMFFVAIAAILCYFSLIVASFFGQISTKFSNLTNAYFEYGFTYCFCNSLFNTGVDKPSDYSEDTIESIKETVESTETVNEDEVSTPNIIFLQLESFFDVTLVEGLEVSQDPIPNFRALLEEYPSGYLNVNNVGYGTANTEFEIMTGMNLEDFGPGEFPFKTILRTTTCESIAYNLKEYGYATHAMHNNTATFYSRYKVFANLGFDDYESSETMVITEYTPLGWAKDSVLTGEIEDVLTSTDTQDLIYCISVQGHGAYPVTQTLEDPVITVDGIDEDRYYQFEYYANMIYEMDQFIAELIDMLESIDEDTILVMYGDHLPSLGITEDDIPCSIYQTQYVIWNNFDLDLDDADIETYQLASRILEALNMDAGIINKFHQVYADGDETTYLTNLKTLEYDILYGEKYVYGGTNPYVATDIVFGLKDIIIGDVYVDEELGKIVVSGSGFTTSCYVYINEEEYETEFVDENTLTIELTDLAQLDSIVVSMNTSSVVLKTSTEFIYTGEDYVYQGAEPQE